MAKDLEKMVRSLLARLGPELEDDQELAGRFRGEFPRLAGLLHGLYGHRADFAYQMEDLARTLLESRRDRPEVLRQRDRDLPPESGWFLDSHQVGAVCYADLWAGNLAGLKERIPYLKELGVTYLHLMPFFQVPQPENDGGYAVSDYRSVRPDLGTMEDLEDLSRALTEKGIALVGDFVFNHTAGDHLWARKAAEGDPDFQDYYWLFPDEASTAAYSPWLREIFPEVRRGSFTWRDDMKKWVWTTFHSYQWDLNYSNPEVFRAMAGELLHLANRGVHILRLDAVAFIWKQAGTGCENLPEAHTLIQAFQAATRIAAPSLLFKSEAIVHPDDILKYVDQRECQLSYNPLLMAELWEAAATRDVKLLHYSISRRSWLPRGTTWVNYLRCHDDIGWTFADEDAQALGMSGHDHRRFLNQFYTGEFPGSFSKGLSFQYNPANGDMRICGTAASLAGVEKARESGSSAEMDRAVNRLLTMYAVVFTAGGIPLIYLGDEVGMENDYSYRRDPGKSYDSRWVHRSSADREREARAAGGSDTPEGRIRAGFLRMVGIRKSQKALGDGVLRVLESPHPGVLVFSREKDGERVTVVASFSDGPVVLSAGWARQEGLEGSRDLWTGWNWTAGDWTLDPCGLGIFRS